MSQWSVDGGSLRGRVSQRGSRVESSGVRFGVSIVPGEDADDFIQQANALLDRLRVQPMVHTEVASAGFAGGACEKSRKRIYSWRLRRP